MTNWLGGDSSAFLGSPALGHESAKRPKHADNKRLRICSDLTPIHLYMAVSLHMAVSLQLSGHVFDDARMPKKGVVVQQLVSNFWMLVAETRLYRKLKGTANTKLDILTWMQIRFQVINARASQP
jgi:hypothetical protein